MLHQITPENKEAWLKLRLEDITSTDTAALFGCSPYLTKFELWHRKKDKTIVEFSENERMKWGNRLESAIANGIAEDHGWTVRPMKDYWRDTDARIGASFDFQIEPHGILEIKNVDGLVFQNQWVENDDGSIEAPLHIEIQVQHQLAVSGMSLSYIGALVGGNRVILIERKRDEAVISAIKDEALKFWESIANNQPPEPDFKTDSDFISKLYGHAEPGKVVDVSESAEIAQLCLNYRELAQKEKDLDLSKAAIKAELLSKIGDAEKAIGTNYTISAGLIGPSQLNYERKGYRNFRINWRK